MATTFWLHKLAITLIVLMAVIFAIWAIEVWRDKHRKMK